MNDNFNLFLKLIVQRTYIKSIIFEEDDIEKWKSHIILNNRLDTLQEWRSIGSRGEGAV